MGDDCPALPRRRDVPLCRNERVLIIRRRNLFDDIATAISTGNGCLPHGADRHRRTGHSHTRFGRLASLRPRRC